MRTLKAAIALMMLLVCAAVFVTPARADMWDKKTTFTFGQTVEMPGLVLLAGTYTFKVYGFAPNVVWVYNQDESMLLGNVRAISERRVETTNKPALQLREMPENAPQEISAWFYPGEITGWQFVYPR